jgi:uncharacterized membrane protein
MFKFLQTIVREVILTLFPKRCFESTVYVGDNEPFWSVKVTDHEVFRYLGNNWYLRVV